MLRVRDGRLYARPDDVAGASARSWRDLLVEYNQTSSEENRFGLFPAWRLYSNPAYGDLVAALGGDNVYVLSAGWGLIRSDFLTPQYDITFSAQAEPYKRRRRGDVYKDFCQLDRASGGQVLFLGGKDYVPLFCELTAGAKAQRIVFFGSETPPRAPGCSLVKYPTTRRTNWHYACVNDFVAGRLSVPPER